ncbi:MAG: hypothetical protein JNJ64_06455, partial [Flavobacteriales bacterium]|nr:hypothetical protein [Flavobacteriales bacterium]
MRSGLNRSHDDLASISGNHDPVRNRYAPISSLVLLSLFALQTHAQLIPIPDPGLRSLYNSWVPGCVDANGDLDAALQGVQEFDQEVTIDYTSDVVQVNGLEAFLSLRVLHINSDEITDLDAFPPALGSLSVQFPGFSTWPPFPATLRSLQLNYSAAPGNLLPDISSTQLENFELLYPPWDEDLSTFTFPTTLRYLGIWGSEGVSSLAPLPDGLDSLTLSSCFYLTSLPPLPTSLRTLNVFECPLEGELVLPPRLEVCYCSITNISSLPSLPSSLRRLILEMCPVSCLPLLPEGLEYLDLVQTEIQCLPNEPADCYMTYHTENLGLCSTLNSVCPCQNPGVGGSVYHDANGSGVQDAGEPGCSYVSLFVDPLGYVGGVPLNGEYDLGLIPGEYTITCVPYMPFIQNVAPLTHTANLATQTSYDGE